jgi:hypothetical protein
MISRLIGTSLFSDRTEFSAVPLFPSARRPTPRRAPVWVYTLGMRIFFIVAAAVLFADFVESSLKLWNKIYSRIAEKTLGVTEAEYSEQYLKEHPNTKMQLIPFFWLAVVFVGFLWAVFWH